MTPKAAPTPQAGRALRFLTIMLLLWSGGRVGFLYGPGLFFSAGRLPAGQASEARLPPAGTSGDLPAISNGPAYGGQSSIMEEKPTSFPAAPIDDGDKGWPVDIRQANLAGNITPYAPQEAAPPPSAITSVPEQANGQRIENSASVPLSSPHRPARPRWAGAAWILWRDKSPAGAIARNGQLGGAQAGMRIDRYTGIRRAGCRKRSR